MVKKERIGVVVSDKPENNCSSDSNTLPTSEISKNLNQNKALHGA
jgi:hypothetical protein